MLYGTEKQLKWANDIIHRIDRFDEKVAILEEMIDDNKLLDVTKKVRRRAEEAKMEKDASLLINCYGYLGLENKRESLKRYLLDMVDTEDVVLVYGIMLVAKRHGIK